MKFIKSKAAILRNLNKPLDITNIYVPTKLLQGQILVKMIYSGICGSQLGEIKGIKGKDKFLPHLLGHEGIAEVIKVGKKVTKVKKKIMFYYIGCLVMELIQKLQHTSTKIKIK